MAKYNIPKTITHTGRRYYILKETRILDNFPITGYGLYDAGPRAGMGMLRGFVSSAGGGKWQAIRMQLYPVGQHPPSGDEYEVLMGVFPTIRAALHAILTR